MIKTKHPYIKPGKTVRYKDWGSLILSVNWLTEQAEPCTPWDGILWVNFNEVEEYVK